MDTTMPLRNSFLSALHTAATKIPSVIKNYRALKELSKRDPLVTAVYRKLFERHRLTLPATAPEPLCPESGTVALAVLYPLFAGEDAPLNDLLFLLNLAKGRQCKRILEVGTYRARTTLALHLNCPEAQIVSYDIHPLDSPFRQALRGIAKVELRHGSFSASADALRNDPPFDLIFVDGSHQFQHVIEDSRLALEIAAPDGAVVWHDYRYNGYPTKELRVPEALTIISRSWPIEAVAGTTCAIHLRGGAGNGCRSARHQEP